MDYESLISRNKGYISDELQKKIKRCRVFLLGCGLGSQIALLATRTGFENFILIDGDTVDVNNLNRQSFRRRHLDKNKAEALASMIKDINPQAKIDCYPKFLKDEKLAKELIDNSDVVVNMADPETMMYFVNDYSRESGKPVFFPLNIAWGGCVLIFTPDSPGLKEILGKRLFEGNRFYVELIKKTFLTFPPTLLEFYKKKGKELLSLSYIPQLGTSSYLTSAIVIQGIIKWIAGETIKKAPRPIFLDLWEETS
jgi:molybdopterin/thiamine biosynthesis adenylyltransferase